MNPKERFSQEFLGAIEAGKDVVVHENYDKSQFTLKSDHVWRKVRTFLCEATRIKNRFLTGHEKAEAEKMLTEFKTAYSGFLEQIQ